MLEEQQSLFAVMDRIPASATPATMLDLNLQETGLRDVDLSAYVSLQRLKYVACLRGGRCMVSYSTPTGALTVLVVVCTTAVCVCLCVCGLRSLRGNRLSATAFISGTLGASLRLLPQLTAIDLRENDMNLSEAANLTGVADVLCQLTALRSLGLCGNWDAEDRRWYVTQMAAVWCRGVSVYHRVHALQSARRVSAPDRTMLWDVLSSSFSFCLQCGGAAVSRRTRQCGWCAVLHPTPAVLDVD